MRYVGLRGSWKASVIFCAVVFALTMCGRGSPMSSPAENNQPGNPPAIALGEDGQPVAGSVAPEGYEFHYVTPIPKPDPINLVGRAFTQ